MEDSLLLFCLGMENEESKVSTIRQWTDSEWNELIRQSNRHGVTAYLSHRLKAMGAASAVPPRVELRFRETTLKNASRNIRLVHGLGKAIRVLREDGIPVILLKGAHLAEAVYGNIALRRMGDADILVRKDDLHAAVTRLIEAGFGVPSEVLNEYMDRTADMPYHIFPESKHFFDLVFPGWPAKLDVHVSLAPENSGFAVDTGGLWERAVRSDGTGWDALALSPVDSILYQCMHASFHHHFTLGLRPLCDISETLRQWRKEIDWEDLRLRALMWKAERCAWLTLRFAREMLGAAVPDAELKALEPRKPESAKVEWARQRIFEHTSGDGSLPDNLVQLCKARRLRDKAAAVRKAVFPSRQGMAVMYHTSPASLRIYLYYPLRLVDLIRRYGFTGWRLLFRDKKTRSVLEDENGKVALKQWLVSGESNSGTDA